MKWAPLIASGLLLCAGTALADTITHVRVSKFSGKQVPRFETLRYAAVNGRTGPSRAHPVVWRYERKGLPVLIIKESEDWRRVRDPSGDEVWIHARMLEAGAGAITETAVTLRVAPEQDSEEVARVEAGVLAKLGDCEAQWCEIQTGGYSGWAPRKSLWGAETSEASL